MNKTWKKMLSASVSALMLAGFATMGKAHANQLTAMSDQELSDVNAQALLSLSYISPTDAENKMGNGVGFYRLGLDAELKLNANINKLQLGCGGINGAGGCDIDIDNLSLSGIADTREGRVGSSAVMTNPFVEFAIKNPNSASTREFVGMRLSAEHVLGLLTLGSENSATPNGINSFSGYMRTLDTTGVASTTARNMSFNDTQMTIDGRIKLLGSLISPGFSSRDYNLGLQSTNANLFINGATISGTRMTHANLTGKAQIGNINFTGPINANLKIPILGLLDLGIDSKGYISGLTADLNISQNLGFIHKLPLNNPFSLSLQNQQVFWPGAAVAANAGWWMAFEDAIDIGQLNPSNTIDITDDLLKQVVPKVNTFLQNNPPSCFFGSCLGIGLDIGDINLKGSSALDFPIRDLQLETQHFAPNCYGSLKFC